MIKETDFYDKTKQLSGGVRSILIVGTDGAAVSYYRRERNVASRFKADRELMSMTADICRIASCQYIDQPYSPILVRKGELCVIVLRSFMRDAGILVVIEPEFHTVPEVMWYRDEQTEQFYFSAFDAISQRLCSGGASHLGFITSPYCATSDARGCGSHIIKYAEAIAHFTECTVIAIDKTDENICGDCNIDMGLTASAVVLTLLLLQRESDGQGIVLEVSRAELSLAVELRCGLRRGADIKHSTELEVCHRISRRFNMPFEFCAQDGNISIRFCPSKIEWSELGIKTRSELEYDM